MPTSDAGTLTQGDEAAPAGVTPAPHLFRVFQCDRSMMPPSRHALVETDRVAIGRGAETGAVRDEAGRALSISVADRWASSSHAALHKRFGRWVLEDVGSKNGTFVNRARIQSCTLRDGDLVEIGHTFFLYREACPWHAGSQRDIDAPRELDRLATLSPALERTFALLCKVAPSNVPVLIRGETGSGKDVVAERLHALSGRSGPLVAVNCGAMPDTLVEAELFGAKKGAYSGAATERIGLVRSAQGGTLFLDEVAELSPHAQVALLRVLQDGHVLPVGATRPESVDVRVVAATHQNLEAMMESGAFRRDLYARLDGLTVSLPALKVRREDIGLLVGQLLRRFDAESVTFTVEAARALFSYDWPLNVRDLEQCLGAAVVLAEHKVIEAQHLPGRLLQPTERQRSSAPVLAAAPTEEDDAARRAKLTALLTTHRGNISAVAREMGAARVQIRRWLKRYGLDSESFRGDSADERAGDKH